MVKSIYLLLAISFLTGCGDHYVADTDQRPHAYVDLRPYPKPTQLDLDEQKAIEPVPEKNFWKLSYAEYLLVYDLNKKLIAHMKECRVIGRYFADGINDFNREQEEKNIAIGAANDKKREELNRPPAWQFWK